MHELFHSNPLIPCRLEMLRLGPLQFAPSWDCSICHLGFTPVTIYANGDREQWITLQEWLEKFIGMFWCHFLACCLLSSVTHSKPMGVSAWHWKERLLKYSFKRRRKKSLKIFESIQQEKSLPLSPGLIPEPLLQNVLTLASRQMCFSG